MFESRGGTMADINNLLLKYFRIQHIDNMDPAKLARFNDMNANDELSRELKIWRDNYMVCDAAGKCHATYLPDFNALLNASEWEQLYNAFNQTLQNMYGRKDTDFEFNKPVKDFLARWFDGNYGSSNVRGRIFAQSEATTATKNTLDELKIFLDQNDAHFSVALQPLLGEMSYDDFKSKLSKAKYNSNLKFRETVANVASKIYFWSDRGSEGGAEASHWPAGKRLPPALATGLETLNQDFDAGFEVPDKADRLTRFKTKYEDILNTLLTKKTIRDAFAGSDFNGSVKISKQLEKALNQTNYDDPTNSQTYRELEPRYVDTKTLGQRFDKWKADTYEDYLRKFVDPKRGTRLYFSQQAQNIIKAFDKVGIKPTDGIDGILSKAEGAKSVIETIGKSANTTKAHFDWFVSTMKKIKSEIPNAYKGALHNGAQLKTVVSSLIIKAVQSGKIDEAKTAMEVLSVAKYGMLTSKTLDAVNEGLKDAKLFSDTGLSWNKNEGIQTVTKAIDGTIKMGIRVIGATTAGLYNTYQRGRTKIGNDIRNNHDLSTAYNNWQDKHDKQQQSLTTQKQNIEAQIKTSTQDRDAIIAALNANGKTFNGQSINKNNVLDYLKQELKDKLKAENDITGQLDDANRYFNNTNNINRLRANAATITSRMSGFAPGTYDYDILSDQLKEINEVIQQLTDRNKEIEDAHNTGPTIHQLVAQRANLQIQKNIANAEFMATENHLLNVNKLLDLQAQLETVNKDLEKEKSQAPYKELIAYWDMLESVSRTHSFTLGSMAVKRRAFLKNEAKTQITDFRNSFGPIIAR